MTHHTTFSKIRLLSLGLLLTALFALHGASYALAVPTPQERVETVEVLGTATTLPTRMGAYSQPSVGSSIVVILNRGTQVQVLGFSDDLHWTQVLVPGQDSPLWVARIMLLYASGESPTTAVLRVPASAANAGSAEADVAVAQTDEAQTDEAEAGEAAANEAAPETPAPVPTATATPQPTPSVPTAFTQPARMNVRSGPGTEYSVVTSVPQGTAAEILAVGPDNAWWQVQLANLSEPAWLFRSLTTTGGDLSGIPQLSEEEIPPRPTPAPAPVVQAAAAPVAAPSGAVAPVAGGRFGYGFQIQIWGNNADIGFAVNATRNAGFNWLKFQIPWHFIEGGRRGQYDWGRLDYVINEVNSAGINIMLSIVKAPAWARSPETNFGVEGPPANNQDYADFVRTVAGRYAGRIQAIEVWNEPNLHHEWGDEPLDAGRYVDMLCRSFNAIKSVDPGIAVISAGLTPAGNNFGTIQYSRDDVEYLQEMYQRGARPCMDGVGVHPSGFGNPPSVTIQDFQQGRYTPPPSHYNHRSFYFRSTLEEYRRVMVANGDGNKLLWPTEFGWAVSSMPNPGYEYAAYITEQTQASYLVQAFEYMRSVGWVGPAFAWNLNFGITNPGEELAQFAIYGRPAYNALQNMPK